MNRKQNLSHNLHDLSQIEPCAEITRRAIDRAQAAINDQPIKPIAKHGVKLMRPRNLATLAAAAAAAVMFLLTAWLSSLGTGGSVAFAQVQAEVEKTKSVQYVQTHRFVTKKGKKAPVIEDRVMVLGNVQRKESSVIEPGDELPEDESWGAPTEKIIDIYDPEKGKMLMIFPDKKGYSYVKEVLHITDDGKIGSEKVKPAKAAFYELLRQVPAEKAKQLPAKEIDGKDAVGFLVEEKIKRKQGDDTWKKTYWVDPKTKLPIRIETSVTSTNPMHGDSTWVTRDIVFDAPLDPALFSTDPPEGYTDLAKLAQNPPNSKLTGNGLVKALVFAEVVTALRAELEKAHSLQYTEVAKFKANNNIFLTEQTRTVKILNDKLKQEELKLNRFALYGVEQPLDGVNTHVAVTYDLAKKAILTLRPGNQSFSRQPFNGNLSDASTWIAPSVSTPANRKGDPAASKITWHVGQHKPPFQMDFDDLIRNVPEHKATPLPEKEIRGRKVMGFLVEKKVKADAVDARDDDTATWRHTWWVDAKTKLPVEIDCSYRSTYKMANAIDCVVTDITFDTPLDPALFSIEPPEDYKNVGRKPKANNR